MSTRGVVKRQVAWYRNRYGAGAEQRVKEIIAALDWREIKHPHLDNVLTELRRAAQ